MTKEKISNCICGGEADLDWTRCTDYKGSSYQDVILQCKKCFRSVSITYDCDSKKDKESWAAQNMIIGVWNKFVGDATNE